VLSPLEALYQYGTPALSSKYSALQVRKEENVSAMPGPTCVPLPLVAHRRRRNPAGWAQLMEGTQPLLLSGCEATRLFFTRFMALAEFQRHDNRTQGERSDIAAFKESVREDVDTVFLHKSAGHAPGQCLCLAFRRCSDTLLWRCEHQRESGF
jgi:hypothetical protein